DDRGRAVGKLVLFVAERPYDSSLYFHVRVVCEFQGFRNRHDPQVIGTSKAALPLGMRGKRENAQRQCAGGQEIKGTLHSESPMTRGSGVGKRLAGQP